MAKHVDHASDPDARSCHPVIEPQLNLPSTNPIATHGEEEGIDGAACGDVLVE